MTDNSGYIKKWLIPGEKIIDKVDEILWEIQSSGSFSDDKSPRDEGSMVLTNHRLIFIFRDSYQDHPKWYSVTAMASLVERPPRYKRSWPYQAKLVLFSGITLVLETPKDSIDNRGKRLSRLLTKALILLNHNQRFEYLLANLIQDKFKAKPDDTHESDNEDESDDDGKSRAFEDWYESDSGSHWF